MEKREKDLKKIYRRDINKGYVILYLVVIICIVLGELLLYNFPQIPFHDFLSGTIENLVGVLAAFFIFDIAHERLSKESYAIEVSEQILDTLMYNPDVIEIYEDKQKINFVNSFIESIAKDQDISEMIKSQLNTYLLSPKDFKNNKYLSEKDCRLRLQFSYRFVLENERTKAFENLKAPIVNNTDPYFYVQEELAYKVKYLSPKGNYTDKSIVKIGFIYNNVELDRFLRGNKVGRDEELLKNCLFRESLDILDIDKKMFEELSSDPDQLIALVKKMFRPHLNIDHFSGEICGVQVIPKSGIIVMFKVDHDIDQMEHNINIIFHMPKKWNTVLEVMLVEPTKNPMISVSYNEDKMDIEMYSFLNKGESSSYDSTYESENGVYRISIDDEWVFPISGVVFPIKRDGGCDNIGKQD